MSIKDIAHAAGVSHPTVSRALSDNPLVSWKTRKRIQQLAREMGYTPNKVAQSLQTRQTHTIGVIVTSIADPFFADVVKGVEEVAHPAGLSVFLSSSYNDPGRELEIMEIYQRRRVDGFVIASSRIGSAHGDRLASINVPVVLVSSQAESDVEFLHYVGLDDRAGAATAVTHLLELGHLRIGYIGVDNRPRSNQRRRDGYLDAMHRAGIEPPPEWIQIGQVPTSSPAGDVQAGEISFTRLLPADLTAIFCYNDMVAVGAMQACRQHGVDVPAACSLVGFDDVELSRYVSPRLTTIHQPKQEMGRIGMEMMLALLQGRDVSSRVLNAELVERESTARPVTPAGAGSDAAATAALRRSRPMTPRRS